MDIQASSYGSISLIILVGLLTLLCFIAWSYTIQRDELLRCEKTHSRVVCLHTLNP